MTAATKLKEQVSPTGLTLFGPLPETEDYYLLWAGFGSSLRLVIRPFATDGVMTSIEHPTANGIYDTRAEARAAANAFATYKDGE